MTALADYNNHLKQYLETSAARQANEIGLFVAEMVGEVKTDLQGQLDTLTDVDISQIQAFVEQVKGLLDENTETGEFDAGANIINRLTELSNRVTRNENDIVSINQALNSLGNAVDAAKAEAAANLATAKAALETQIAAVDAKATANADNLTAEIARAKAREDEIEAALQAEIARATAAEAALGTRIDGVEGRVTTVEGEVGALKGRVTSLETKADANEAKTAENAAAIAAEKARAEAAEAGKVDKTEVLAAWDNLDPTITAFAAGLRTGYNSYVAATVDNPDVPVMRPITFDPTMIDSTMINIR